MKNNIFCFALGIGSQNNTKEWLEVFYPQIFFQPKIELIELLSNVFNTKNENCFLELEKEHIKKLIHLSINTDHFSFLKPYLELMQKESPRKLVFTFIVNDIEPISVPEIYLKLHLISHRYVKPNQINLTGIFSKLPNIAWTNKGAVALDELPLKQTQARIDGEIINVKSIDKFPQMSDYIVPKGVRIADTSRVRLGAYLGEGTTVMHEGFVNFNAGTEGPNMVEGRISAGVVVDKGSDLGGGCSTMGTLSGGNNVLISVGQDCLIGANAGLAIPLGDRCTIEAGLYLTGGAKVMLIDHNGEEKEFVKASQLSHVSDLLFRRNSKNGRIECLKNKSAIQLNKELHTKN